jgi:succinoglycan biosynthesis protein ExoM
MKIEIPAGIDVDFLIVDNDLLGSAKKVIDDVGIKQYYDVKYVIEEKKGLSSARNRAISLIDGIDWLVFIDDDEFPDKNWLLNLSHNFKPGVDIVQGAVYAIYNDDAPSWIKNGGFFQREIHEKNKKLDTASCCNVAIRVDVINKNKFKDVFNSSGGEDTEFFFQLFKDGFSIYFDPSSVLYEVIDSNKTNDEYLSKRAMRTGITYANVFYKDLNGVDKINVLSKLFVKLSFFGLSLAVFCFFKSKRKVYKYKFIHGFYKIYGCFLVKEIKLY